MLNGIADLPGGLFVTAPDVVGDAEATTELFYQWKDDIRSIGKPVAYVTQDGLTEPPWDDLDALFLGGSSVWKMGRVNREIVHEAKRRGLWVHMGRVNGRERVRYAKAIGCDSFDGTSMSWFKDDKLRRLLKATALPTQLIMETP
jgi:hypothetical protein